MNVGIFVSLHGFQCPNYSVLNLGLEGLEVPKFLTRDLVTHYARDPDGRLCLCTSLPLSTPLPRLPRSVFLLFSVTRSRRVRVIDPPLPLG